MNIVPGNALVQSTPGAAARPDHPSSRPQAFATSDHDRGSVAADRLPRDSKPVIQTSAGERPRADLPRGSLLDIRV